MVSTPDTSTSGPDESGTLVQAENGKGTFDISSDGLILGVPKGFSPKAVMGFKSIPRMSDEISVAWIWSSMNPEADRAEVSRGNMDGGWLSGSPSEVLKPEGCGYGAPRLTSQSYTQRVPRSEQREQLGVA